MFVLSVCAQETGRLDRAGAIASLFMTEREYVLGTNDEEIERLGLQHVVWRPWMFAAWRRAGITRGSRVLDIGAGPGFATADLAEVVGAAGEVLGLERSARFVAAARRRCDDRKFAHARIEEIDLMADAIPAASFDAAWCRWVACFVSSPASLLTSVAQALKPDGVAIFHEYGDYASWRLMPRRRPMDEFVAAVMASWRESGGNPDVGLTLPTALRECGFLVRGVRPLVFAVRPTDLVWQWPATFLRAGAQRLLQLGRLSAGDVESLLSEFDAVERDSSNVMMTPLVLEIIAQRCA
jgi:SAM-dependent methyltransferase